MGCGVLGVLRWLWFEGRDQRARQETMGAGAREQEAREPGSQGTRAPGRAREGQGVRSHGAGAGSRQGAGRPEAREPEGQEQGAEGPFLSRIADTVRDSHSGGSFLSTKIADTIRDSHSGGSFLSTQNRRYYS